jgi:hypothetical protein
VFGSAVFAPSIAAGSSALASYFREEFGTARAKCDGLVKPARRLTFAAVARAAEQISRASRKQGPVKAAVDEKLVRGLSPLPLTSVPKADIAG